MNEYIYERIANRLQKDGYACTSDDIRRVHEEGTHENSALASAAIRELEEYGLL